TSRRVMINDSAIVIHCLKKHKTDQQGRLKQAQFRSVPVPASLIEHLDLVFGLRSQLRHGFGVALVTANPPVPLHVISQLMGHSDSKTTEIYLQVLSEERHSLVMNAWA
ncbi:MAG: tyrosine-type recombinase/integrase, partial [Shewanella sp.]